MTRVEIGLEQLLTQFAKGDRHARRDMMEYADKLGIDFLAKQRQAIEETLGSNRQAILDAYVARRSGTAKVAPAAPALAPPELLDDDAAEEKRKRRRKARRKSNEPHQASAPGVARSW